VKLEDIDDDEEEDEDERSIVVRLENDAKLIQASGGHLDQGLHPPQLVAEALRLSPPLDEDQRRLLPLDEIQDPPQAGGGLRRGAEV
jgi:hypothetical protein